MSKLAGGGTVRGTMAIKFSRIPSSAVTSSPYRIGSVLLGFLIASQAPAQDPSAYPDPFPGGYADAGFRGAGKMYMESYFPPPVTASPTYPAWSPDGMSLAFAYQGRIWEVPVEGGVARQLTRGAGYDSQPSWSPDGRHVAYASDVDRNFDIYVVERATGESRQITTDPHLDLRPRWSQDGASVLFTTGRKGSFDLWRYDMERGGAAPVVSSEENNMAGDWVGDGGDVVFVSRRGEAALGSGSLWRWRAEASQSELLLRIETNYQAAPVVAPHGGVVAYITDASGNNDLYVVPSEKSPRGIQPIRIDAYTRRRVFPELVAGQRATRVREEWWDARTEANG